MAIEYSLKHYLFRIHGSFGQTATALLDEWTTGFRLALPASDVPDLIDYTSFLETVSAVIQTFHTSAAVGAGNLTFLKRLTIARVGLDGKYDPPTRETTERPYPSPPAGTGQVNHPFNTACVISLRTHLPRGIGSNGRAYWPTLNLPVDQLTGRLSSTTQNAYATAAQTMVNGINAAAAAQIAPGVRVCVMGQTGRTGVARVGVVNAIRVDQRLDSIERRENKQPAVWVEKAIA